MGSTKRNNKRGSYIMEASLVLPVLIFAVITVVLIIMFFLQPDDAAKSDAYRPASGSGKADRDDDLGTCS